jgi:hypothetical protein
MPALHRGICRVCRWRREAIVPAEQPTVHSLAANGRSAGSVELVTACVSIHVNGLHIDGQHRCSAAAYQGADGFVPIPREEAPNSKHWPAHLLLVIWSVQHGTIYDVSLCKADFDRITSHAGGDAKLEGVQQHGVVHSWHAGQGRGQKNHGRTACSGSLSQERQRCSG